MEVQTDGLVSWLDLKNSQLSLKVSCQTNHEVWIPEVYLIHIKFSTCGSLRQGTLTALITEEQYE